MKIAIIGGGPAAFGALTRLIDIKKEFPSLKIDIFTSGNPNQEPNIYKNYKKSYSDLDINKIINNLKRQNKGILPQRFFNGKILQNFTNSLDKKSIKFSEKFGGVGNFWSSSLYTTNKYFDQYANKLGNLGEHYSFISKHIPISGQIDEKLSNFFDTDTINCSPIPISDTLSDLIGFKKNYLNQNMDLGIGTNRFSININQYKKNGCTLCGDCMYSCPRDAIFRASKYIFEMSQSSLCRIKYEKVFKIIVNSNKIKLKTRQKNYFYDKVFLCGGALGTAELILRSFGNKDSELCIYDNFLYYFPAISIKRKNTSLNGQSLEFAELAGGIFNHNDNSYNHILVSTIPKVLSEYLFQRNAFSKALTNFVSGHAILIAVYGSNDEYYKHQIKLASDKLSLISIKKSTHEINKNKITLIKKYFHQFGWHTFNILRFEYETSNHYTSNIGIAFKKSNIDSTGKFDKNIFICDSSTWNSASMSQPHTFTIMANASRIVLNTIKNKF